MKKAAILFVCISLLIPAFNCFADGINSKYDGVSFFLSDNWVRDYKDENVFLFRPADKSDQIFWLAVTDFSDQFWAYSMDFFDEDDFGQYWRDYFSKEALEKDWFKSYGKNVNVEIGYNHTSYEVHNGVIYYKYEQAYTVTDAGLMNTLEYYSIAYSTVKNGKSYDYYYNREITQPNRFSDIVSILNTVSYENGEIKIYINGKMIYPDQAPVLIGGRTLVPIRAVAEELGYTVGWNERTEVVTITEPYSGNSLEFGIGFSEATKNTTQIVDLDVPPFIIGGRTYLPLRVVAEEMNASVNWNGKDRSVEIYK